MPMFMPEHPIERIPIGISRVISGVILEKKCRFNSSDNLNAIFGGIT